MTDLRVSEAIERAERVLRRAVATTDLRSPMAALLHRRAGDASRLVEFWQERAPGSRLSDARYRWELRHERAGKVPYLPETWTPWRPRDAARFERHREEFELRFTLPIAVTEAIELLAGSDRPEAATILHETEPVARADLAGFVRAAHAWTDTFALYCLTRCPRALERMRPFAIAITASYAPGAEEHGFVRGTRFPFHDRPLTSGSSMLAAGLYALATDIPLVGRLAAHVGAAQRDDGGFGDDDEPSDVLTTLLATELLARLEPGFDPGTAARFLVGQQTDEGWFRALGPETPWLTALAIDTLRASGRPFARRFAWPRVPEADLDRKTALPSFSFFVDVAELAAALPGLAAAPTTVCFMDLIGFRAFNNTYGQRMGDEVLALFADELRTLDEAVAVRDGGDELLLIGAPTGTGLGAAIEALRDRWPDRFRARFGQEAPPVTARYLTAEVEGRALREAREVLGRAVGDLKHVDGIGGRGVRKDLGRLETRG